MTPRATRCGVFTGKSPRQAASEDGQPELLGHRGRGPEKVYVFTGEWVQVDPGPGVRRTLAAWLPGLAAEGVVGADAIFSCLGPALEPCSVTVCPLSGRK